MLSTRAVLFIRTLCLLVAIPLPFGAARATSATVFSADFESGIPAAISAPGSVLNGVAGWGGLGPTGHQFGGSFLRYTSVPILPTTLTVRDLPPHETLDLDFLLALIDSWDGTELFQVRVDGVLLFSHWFQLATGDTSSYIAPAGGLLSRGHELGFSAGSYYSRDRAYDMSVEPVFHGIAHVADSVVISWTIGAVAGPAANQWQGGSDESWAIDGVIVKAASPALAVSDGAQRGLALSPYPNPASCGRLAVSFSLPAAAPATLELLDISGRRLASREVSAFGPGSHTILMADGMRLAPGLYLLRLTQGPVSTTARVAAVGD